MLAYVTGSAFSPARDSASPFPSQPVSHAGMKRPVIRMGRRGRRLSRRLQSHSPGFRPFLASCLLWNLGQVTYLLNHGFLACNVGVVTEQIHVDSRGTASAWHSTRAGLSCVSRRTRCSSTTGCWRGQPVTVVDSMGVEVTALLGHLSILRHVLGWGWQEGWHHGPVCT